MSRAAEYQDFGFPDVEEALTEPNGLLAVGGDLSPARLLYAYRHGIFPWYSHDQPILWWSPDPRSVLFPERFQLRRSLSKRMRNAGFELRVDTCFADVMRACAAPRKGADGTWINADMLNAYTRLHQLGIAHSVETWQDGRLVGGCMALPWGEPFSANRCSARWRMPPRSRWPTWYRDKVRDDSIWWTAKCSPRTWTVWARSTFQGAISSL